jgi:hypothetical protein
MSRSRESVELAKRKAAAKQRYRAERRHLAWAGSGRCSTCAYRAGTVAAGDGEDRGLVRLRRALLDAAAPFYCHHGPDGRELEPDVPDSRRRLCVGHMDAMSARFRAGYYAEHPPDAPEVLDELRAAHAERERLYREGLLAIANGNEDR